jgi:DNA primase
MRRPTSSSRLSDDAFRRLMDEAKSRHNLSDIIGRHTTLKPRGRNEMVGLCPFHVERSPSFEVNDTKGAYKCWGCGKAGDAFTFLRDQEGMTFQQAFETLTGDTFPSVSEEDRAKRRAETEAERAQRIALARQIWARSVPAEGTPAEVYARSRGITMLLPPTIRFVMTPMWRNNDTGEVGRDQPAMACALQDRIGAIVAVQCVFLQNGGRHKYARVRTDGTNVQAKLTFGAMVGAAVRLEPFGTPQPLTEVIVCEGPEDGLTLAQELPGRAVWVACGTANMTMLDYPAEIRRIVLAGDNNEAGRAAVTKAAAAIKEQGRETGLMFPRAGFKDFNDQLREIRS